MLEVLDRPLVLLRRRARGKRPQVLALPRLLIGLTAIDTKFPGLELTNHAYLRCRVPHPMQLHETPAPPKSCQAPAPWQTPKTPTNQTATSRQSHFRLIPLDPLK